MLEAAADPDEVGVTTAWNRVKADVRAVAKTQFNESQQFNFRGIDAVLNAVGPAMRSHGVNPIPRTVELVDRTEYETRNKARMVNSIVKVHWFIRGPKGDEFDGGESYGEAADSGDKGLTKAQSVAFRAWLIIALQIPTGDRDPDADAHERASASDYEQENPVLNSQVQEADTARGELLAKLEPYGWTEEKLVRRYWDDYRKNLRKTLDVAMIQQFAALLEDESKAMDHAENKPPEEGQTATEATQEDSPDAVADKPTGD